MENLSKESILPILDELDKWRRKHYYDKAQNYDVAMRVACAIVASAAGYKSRIEWTDDLKSDPTTMYHKEYDDMVLNRTF